MKLDCSACKGEQTMAQSKVARFSTVVRAIGVIIIIPSLIGIAAAALMFYATGAATVDVMATAQGDAEMAGAAIGASVGIGMSIILGAGSFVGGLIGWLLLMKRKVYKCIKCGFILDRA